MTTETTDQPEPAPEPRRDAFAEQPMPDEPQSDVRIELETGLILRERVRRVEAGGNIALLLTYTRLDPDGAVVLDQSGAPIIAPAHEVTLIGENVTRLGGGLDAAILAGREIAVARAADHFAGLEQISDLMVARLGSRASGVSAGQPG